MLPSCFNSFLINPNHYMYYFHVKVAIYSVADSIFEFSKATYAGYVNTLPNNIHLAAIKSAIYSFAIATLFSKNMQDRMQLSKAGAAAAIVGALTMPFFYYVFGNRIKDISQSQSQSTISASITGYKLIVSKIIALTITQLLINSLISSRIDFTLTNLGIIIGHFPFLFKEYSIEKAYSITII
jgi:hypothetical protein